MKNFTLSFFALIFLAIAGIHTSLFATTYTVQVGNYYFNPSSLNVEVGDIVKWVWVQGTHTTTSTTIPAGAASWDKPITSSNQTYSYTVTVAGTYNYKCTPHAGMGMVGSFTATAPAPTLSVTPSNQNVTPAAGSTNFSITSNISWTASSNATWCTVTSSGTGNGTLTANYEVNSQTSQRIATITISGPGVSDQVVTVTQSGAAATLAVMPPSQAVTALSGMAEFSVASNSSWTATSDAAWCSVTSSGSGNGLLTATYEENTSYSERTANITVSVSGLSPVIVTVVQDASTVGVRDNNSTSIHIFPNPVKDVLKINLNKEYQNYSISIIDLTGKTVIEKDGSRNKEFTVNVSDLSRGCYFVRIATEEGTTVKRVVISE
jgi:plastocyanin